MDNGLIFPYPCMSVPDESILLTTQNRFHRTPSGVRGGGAAWDPDG